MSSAATTADRALFYPEKLVEAREESSEIMVAGLGRRGLERASKRRRNPSVGLHRFDADHLALRLGGSRPIFFLVGVHRVPNDRNSHWFHPLR